MSADQVAALARQVDDAATIALAELDVAGFFDRTTL